jgi:hypothetical protein
VKFFLSPPDNGQWGQIDESVRTALEKRRRLTAYAVCLPVDLPDARVPRRQSAMDRWRNHVQKWNGWSKDLKMTVNFEFGGTHEILQRLSADEHRGRLFFWFERDVLTKTWFKDRLEEALSAVGPRYTPELDVELRLNRLHARGLVLIFWPAVKVTLIRGAL